MSIQDFLTQCDDVTLDYIENELLPQLIHIDKLNKLRHGCADLRQQIAKATKWKQLVSELNYHKWRGH